MPRFARVPQKRKGRASRAATRERHSADRSGAGRPVLRESLKRVAILSPVAWRTPPRQYGAWETVASNITEGLVSRGWDVTLFATRDSVTRAHLHAVVDRGYEEDPAIDPKVAEYLHISEAFEHAAEFDLIHSHYDFMALSYTRLVKTPVLTTIHGFSSPKIMPVYEKYRDGYFVSISNSDRAPGLNYLATVYNGIDLSLYPLQERGGDHLIFLGRIHPDKGVHLAIEVARLSGLPLLIAGIIQDRTYFREQVEPHLDQTIRYIGPVDVPGKNELFARARALLHLNTIPERFGLVLAEANAAGVPVIAMDLGSCREVIEDGQTGFLVNNVHEAVRALERIGEIDRNACRQRVQECFSIETMVEAYERVYRTIFDLEAEEAIMKPDIVRRYAHNPILTKAEIPYPVETVHNAAVVKHENEYIMLFRSHLRTGRSIIGLARSPDGFHFTADPEPFLTPAQDGPFAAYEEFGVEDPRVTQHGRRVPHHLQRLLAKWRADRPGKDEGLPSGGKVLPHHRGGLSECGDLSREVRRPLCPAGPSPFGNRPLVHLDFLFSGSAFLGRIPAHHAARTVSLGRNEDRSGRAADQDGPGMAFHLSRRFPDHGRIGLPPGGRSS